VGGGEPLRKENLIIDGGGLKEGGTGKGGGNKHGKKRDTGQKAAPQ